MKKNLVISLALITSLTGLAQKVRVRDDVPVRKVKMIETIIKENAEEKSGSPFINAHLPHLKSMHKANTVNVLTLGTSANILGYSGGTRTMVWADDDLNTVVNFHRMGPGATPPSLSGYLGMDIGINRGATQGDWTSQVQVAAATLVGSPQYYDAANFPSAAIYNPDGNTSLANAFLAYFAPNYCNTVTSGFGGYSYGTAGLTNPADTTKHLNWYHPLPYNYIPRGFTVSNKMGLAHMVDIDYKKNDSVLEYQDSIIYGRGVWNPATHDFDYIFRTMAFPCLNSDICADVKIAASPDGMTVWMSALTNLAGATPLRDSTLFPVLRKSIDGGLTWSAPIPIQLDGPNGIAAVKNQYSDYFIQNFFVGPPYPTRDEIPYTTAFDHSLSVDKWGNPHIGVVIGYAPGEYSILSGIDSINNVFDICSCDHGATFQGVYLGALKTLRGTWTSAGGDIASDNRVYISSTKAGDKMFITYNDTRIQDVVDNQNPDIYARGFDLINNMITSDAGANQPNNVTFLSDIMQEAYMQCASHNVFTNNNRYTIPICTQYWSDPALDATFRYIPDFSFTDADFTIPSSFNQFLCGSWGINQNNVEAPFINIHPNPAFSLTNITINLKENSTVALEITNPLAQRVLFMDEGSMSAGSQQFSIDASSLTAGVYFITIKVNGEKYTQKLIVE